LSGREQSGVKDINSGWTVQRREEIARGRRRQEEIGGGRRQKEIEGGRRR